jgi:hypothetical protein
MSCGGPVRMSSALQIDIASACSDPGENLNHRFNEFKG